MHKLKKRYKIKGTIEKKKEKTKTEKVLNVIFIHSVGFCVMWFFMRLIIYWFIQNTWLSVATYDYAAPISPSEYDAVMTKWGFIFSLVIYVASLIFHKKK